MVKLSIIVPTLDGRVPRSLEQAMGSARPEGSSARTDDVEIVVVKGVSPVGKARNVGLRKVRGEYIAWVDSDDEIEEGWIEEILSRVGNADVVVVDCVRGETELKWEPSGKGVLADLLAARGKLSAALWRFVVRRELWDGVKFDETICTGEDYDVLPEVIARAKSVARIKRRYLYSQRKESLSHQRDKAHKRATRRVRRRRLKRWIFTKYWREVIVEAVKAIWWDIREEIKNVLHK